MTCADLGDSVHYYPLRNVGTACVLAIDEEAGGAS